MSVVFNTPTIQSTVAGILHDAKLALGLYPDQLPERPVWPCIVYSRVSKVPQRSHDPGRPSLCRARVQIDCYSNTADTANGLAEAVIDTLLNSSGSGISSIGQIAQRSLPEPGKANLWRESIDFEVWHEDPIPAA